MAQMVFKIEHSNKVASLQSRGFHGKSRVCGVLLSQAIPFVRPSRARCQLWETSPCKLVEFITPKPLNPKPLNPEPLNPKP